MWTIDAVLFDEMGIQLNQGDDNFQQIYKSEYE